MGKHIEMPRDVQDLFANQAEVLSLGKLMATLPWLPIKWRC